MKKYTVVYQTQKLIAIAIVESDAKDARAIKIPDHPQADIIAVFDGEQKNLLEKRT